MVKKLATALLGLMVLAMLSAGCQSKKEPATIQWFNTTYAALTAANQANLNEIGGYKKTDTSAQLVREILEQSWDVTDEASADDMIEWLLTEGHRSDFADQMTTPEMKELASLSRSEQEAHLAGLDLEPSVAACYLSMLEAYGKYGEHAIDAWDYCRVLQLLGQYYVAGYYTKEKAMDRSLEIAKTLQSQFTSWDEMMQSYLYGYQFWQSDDISDPSSGSGQRRQVYESLKSGSDSPYSLDWNTPLEKSW